MQGYPPLHPGLALRIKAKPEYAFDEALGNPNNDYLVVHADHQQTPVVAAPDILQWLQRFATH